MANRTKGEASLDIEGVGSFTLALPFGSRAAAEEKSGLPFHELGERAQRGFHSAIATIVWAALRKHHSEMSIEDVQELLDDHADAFTTAVQRAANDSAPKADGGNGAAGKPKPRRPTKTSGRNGAKRG
ncbi:hypothetical protein [Alteriqipengyuania lutimaris]|uniref:Gene transfer agent family protein n=1 Tax=Alteriqipengyuania lutimaris TaxID=1538146 RepID=A0A395LJA3_9SPHN|nr:hypothetical protein [Alteriqipengyuania lutimaris]MBB3034057.1 hypothetical protein [Alteriqipengyuania lutimaris]RDS77002.1 hypothetical protein DL238_04850 [Alteriqipengyuania lutimaris]